MKVLDSKIFDYVNKLLFYIQSKLDRVRSSSLILTKIDWFIFLAIILVLCISTFAENNQSAVFAFIIPLLVTFKVLITKGEKIELEKCNFYLLVYLLICFITNITSSMPIQSFYGFSKTLLYFGFYFGLCQFLKNKKQLVVPILVVIAILVTIESIIGLIQNSIGVLNIATWQDTSYVNPEDVLTRVYGTLKPYNPNLFGGWLIGGISSIIGICAICIYKKRISGSILSFIALIISTLCIFYTGCRGAYIALFALMLCVLIVLFRMNKQCKIIATVITIVGCVFILLHHGILHRLMSIFILRGDSSTSFRMNVYQAAIEMFKDNPIFGVGVGNKVYREIYGLYMLTGFDALSCYNVLLEIAVESGIFAVITYIVFIFSLIISSIKEFILSKDIQTKIIVFSAFTSILAVMVHGLVDTVYFRPQIQFIFWTMVAILTVFLRK